jgi:hypothetical protein
VGIGPEFGAAGHVVDCLAEAGWWPAARATHDNDSPTAAEREKARSRLDRLVNTGHLIVLDPGDRKTNAIPSRTFT